MKAVDTSVVVAAFGAWHEHHEAARRVVDDARLVAHCAAEAYSVLTRLPAPHRAPPSVARDYLLTQFATPWLSLSGQRLRALLRRLPDVDVSAGATYDAIVAMTAAHAGALLISLDKRAARTYDRLGVAWQAP